MELEQLLKDLKHQFNIDYQLKAYLYEDRIELIDYTPEESFSNGETYEAIYGDIGCLGIEDNKIVYFENHSMHLITPANSKMFVYIANLIGTEIKNYNDYSKLPSIKNLYSLDI